ncbi:MAG TPA: dihydrodipicolinate synthase family protein [Bryobacteraceae bacterium]|nr:dihydrodipicolinate synthase family protein [Bryobacteraceae bacterium]
MKQPRAPEKNPFEGVIIAAVTPRRESETSIDLAATLELIDHLACCGPSAIALLGSTGEFVHFALDDRRHMANFAVKRSRVPILVNVSHSTLDGAVELAREAATSGASGVLLMPPYYFRYDGESIKRFYWEFMRRTGRRLPVLLYNIPQFTSEIPICAARELLSSGEFAGIKDSSGSWDYFLALHDQSIKTPFAVLVGSDGLYAKARRAGAHGVVSGIASAIPELLGALERAITTGDEARIALLDGRLGEFIAQIEHLPAPMGIKEAVNVRKWRAGSMAVPPSPQQATFAEWFRDWLPGVLKESA